MLKPAPLGSYRMHTFFTNILWQSSRFFSSLLNFLEWTDVSVFLQILDFKLPGIRPVKAPLCRESSQLESALRSWKTLAFLEELTEPSRTKNPRPFWERGDHVSGGWGASEEEKKIKWKTCRNFLIRSVGHLFPEGEGQISDVLLYMLAFPLDKGFSESLSL